MIRNRLPLLPATLLGTAALCTALLNPVSTSGSSPVVELPQAPASAVSALGATQTSDELPTVLRPAKDFPALTVRQAGPGYQTLSECNGGPGKPAHGNVPVLCLHHDAPPVGVDVKRQLSTAELIATVDARMDAVQALANEQAQLTGKTAVKATAPEGSVPCYGNGTDGYRVQAVYVVPSDKPDRYDSLVPTIQRLAAWMENTVATSGARLGGERHIRFVTQKQPDGTCRPVVAKVVTAPGGTATLEGSETALANAGLSANNRKYSMWVDDAVYCGVAGTWGDSSPGQDNFSNIYVGYPRSDTACWGYAETHELFHTLGAVQANAPKATPGMHCWDLYDVMCYQDGSGSTMVEVCPVSFSEQLDCGGDTYFNPVPEAGSYLDTHWNTARNQWLATTPGETPAAAIAASIAPISLTPGQPVEVIVTATPGAGATLTGISVGSTGGCTLAQDAEFAATATLNCPATLTTAPTVSATATDTLGGSITATRTATLPTSSVAGVITPTLAGVASSSRTFCPGSSTVSLTLRGVAGSRPVAGAKVNVMRVIPGRAPALLSTITTDAQGQASASVSLSSPGFSLVPVNQGLWSTPAVAVPVRFSGCATEVTGNLSASAGQPGTYVTLSGTLTASPSSAPLGGRVVYLSLYRSSTSTVPLGYVVTNYKGQWAKKVKLNYGGKVLARYAGGTGFLADATWLGAFTAR